MKTWNCWVVFLPEAAFNMKDSKAERRESKFLYCIVAGPGSRCDWSYPWASELYKTHNPPFFFFNFLSQFALGFCHLQSQVSSLTQWWFAKTKTLRFWIPEYLLFLEYPVYFSYFNTVLFLLLKISSFFYFHLVVQIFLLIHLVTAPQQRIPSLCPSPIPSQKQSFPLMFL